MTNKACDIWLKRAVILSFISLASCATLARGTSEIFHITTEPIGAKVTTSLETADSAKARKKDDSLTPIYHGCAATPCQFKVPRRSRFIARIEKDGFVPARLTVRSQAGLGGQSKGTVGTTATIATPLLVDAAATSTASVAGGAVAATGLISGAAILASPLIFVDAASGAMLSLYPNPVALKLTPLSDGHKIDYDLDHLDDPNQTFSKSKK